MAVIARASLVEFFKDQVEGALTQQRVPAPEGTAYYVVRLLADAARSDAEGPAAALLDRRPLALRLAAALHGQCPETSRELRQIADAALLISGFFVHRRPPHGVTTAYYHTLGGYAYGALGQTVGQEPQVLSPIFQDLAERFAVYADVLGEVGQRAQMQTPPGLLRALDDWTATGHRVTARLLVERGMVLPTRGRQDPVQ